jgi:hypothetical protein
MHQPSRLAELDELNTHPLRGGLGKAGAQEVGESLVTWDGLVGPSNVAKRVRRLNL